MASILPFDELNALKLDVSKRFAQGKLKRQDEEDIIDELFDLLLLAYAMGDSVTLQNLGVTLPVSKEPTMYDVLKVVNKKVADKTWKERAEEYFKNGGTEDDITRIAETEMHRVANTAALETAKKAGAKTKTWVTMADEKVRDTHQYLENMTVGIDEDFYTYDGDFASAPGMFELAQNNVNCRCELKFGV